MLVIDKKEKIKNYFNNYKFKINDYGKPYIENNEFYFNKSYSCDLGVLTIENKECGIDIEKIKEYSDVMAKRIFSVDEYNYVNSKKNINYYFTLLWTLKEAYLKYIGTGINIKLGSISFVKNNKLLLKNFDCKFKVIKVDNYVISICLGE